MRIISGKARGTNLKTLDGLNTRPTLDRVKESLFNIIRDYVEDAVVLDLFSGSGALGLEALSRGAKKAFFCDNSKDANKIIMQNIERLKMEDESVVYLSDFQVALDKIKKLDEKPDIIFLDPPYKTSLIIDSLNKIIQCDLLKDNTIIIAETDEKDRVLEEIKCQTNLQIFDLRKYGRVDLIFLKL